ncbi:MAG: hypothetical protein ACR2OR_16190 [Hyphomicrobiales bacterium]
MNFTEVQHYAEQLYAAHGDKAEAEAAQKVTQYEGEGDTEQAEIWRKIRAAVRQMRGPGVS